MEEFLARVGRHLEAEAPQLLAHFEIMAAEARFARSWLDDDLRGLPAGAPVLEIGGGVFLLTCQLAREGFSVTAVEPLGVGFGSFEELGSVVLELAAREGARPTIARCGVEQFECDVRFALAFSVNVMEHVEAPERAIARVSAVLSAGGSYRFICPNYLFPYEPHFNIPILGSKALTWKLMRGRIEGKTGVDDPTGLWASLNWISVPQVKRITRSDPALDVRFETCTLTWMMARALSDPQFARRRSGWMLFVIGALESAGLLRVAAFIPAMLQPIMDVRVTKRI